MKTLSLILAVFAASFAFAQCEDGSKGACCSSAKVIAKKVNGEAEFMAQAQKMMAAAEGKKACCKSTAAKPMARGDKGCCNEVGTVAKFKVYADGKYHFFGCKDSAAEARKELAAKGFAVGDVQKVRSRARIG